MFAQNDQDGESPLLPSQQKETLNSSERCNSVASRK